MGQALLFLGTQIDGDPTVFNMCFPSSPFQTSRRGKAYGGIYIEGFYGAGLEMSFLLPFH